MSPSVLVAGIGNIFQGDDGFGVSVVQRLLAAPQRENVRVMDVGIRSIDLAFALLDNHDLTILVDATARGCAPGTLYTIEIDTRDILPTCAEGSLVNSHGLDPARVLALAKSMGAQFGKILLVGCEPLVLNCEETGQIGLSNTVEAAVNPAVKTIRRIIKAFEVEFFEKEEVLHESR
jgi:hydrogenase maturation protease